MKNLIILRKEVVVRVVLMVTNSSYEGFDVACQVEAILKEEKVVVVKTDYTSIRPYIGGDTAVIAAIFPTSDVRPDWADIKFLAGENVKLIVVTRYPGLHSLWASIVIDTNKRGIHTEPRYIANEILSLLAR